MVTDLPIDTALCSLPLFSKVAGTVAGRRLSSRRRATCKYILFSIVSCQNTDSPIDRRCSLSQSDVGFLNRPKTAEMTGAGLCTAHSTRSVFCRPKGA